MQNDAKDRETTREPKTEGTLTKKEVANKIRWKSKVRAGGPSTLQSGHSLHL